MRRVSLQTTPRRPCPRRLVLATTVAFVLGAGCERKVHVKVRVKTPDVAVATSTAGPTR